MKISGSRDQGGRCKVTVAWELARVNSEHICDSIGLFTSSIQYSNLIDISILLLSIEFNIYVDTIYQNYNNAFKSYALPLTMLC